MSYRGSPYYDMALDGGYRGEEAEQVAGMLEDEDRQCMEAMEAAKRERGEAAGCPTCDIVGGPLVECSVCGLRKKPVGRDAPMMMAAGSYCDHECEGWRLDPRPGHLWPGERHGDAFGHHPDHEAPSLTHDPQPD